MSPTGKYRHRLRQVGRILAAALLFIFLLQGSLLSSTADSPGTSEQSVTQQNILIPGADQQQARNSAGKLHADAAQITLGGPPSNGLLSAHLQFFGTPRVESLPSRLVYTLTTSSCL